MLNVNGAAFALGVLLHDVHWARASRLFSHSHGGYSTKIYRADRLARYQSNQYDIEDAWLPKDEDVHILGFEGEEISSDTQAAAERHTPASK
jgi:hypothetical protein